MSIGIIGYGAFGALVHELVRRFAPHAVVRVYSSRYEPDGTTFFPLSDVASCDAVVLCVPIAAFEETVKKVVPLMRPDTVIVDVATVKMHTTAILRAHAAGRRYIATHPMFGPESYKKKDGAVDGFRIVVAEHTLAPEEYEQLAALLRGWGFAVIEKAAEGHDRELAETLFLTHFIGQIVARGGFARTQIDTVSFGFLMDAVESVRHDTALFADVYRFNPFCEEVLKRFESAEGEVHALLQRSR